MASESFVQNSELIKRAASLAGVGNSAFITGGLVVSEKGDPGPALFTTPQQILDEFTVERKLTKSTHPSIVNAYYLAQSQFLLLGRSLNLATVQAITNLGVTFPYRKGKILNKSVDLAIAITGTVADIVITLGSFVFYKGTAPTPSQGQVLVKFNTVADITEYFRNSSEFEMTTEPDSVTVSSTVTTTWDNLLTTQGSVATSTSGVTATGTFMTTSIGAPAFLIVPNAPSAVNLHKVQITSGGTGDSVIHTLTIDDIDYEVSLDPDKSNDVGVNVYIERLNDLNKGWSIVVIDGDQDITDLAETNFGNSGVDLAECATSETLIRTLTTFLKQDEYILKGMSMLGTENFQYQVALVNACKSRFIFTPTEAPSQYLDKDQIAAYKTSTGLDTDQAHWLSGWTETNAITKFKIKLPPSTLYWERAALNASQRLPYVPIFLEDYGRVASFKLLQRFEQTDREWLLNYQINSIAFDARRGISWINDNRTGKKIEDVMKEDNNRRAANQVYWDFKKLMRQFLSKDNDEKTREEVVDIGGEYFRTVVFAQQTPVKAYRIICDSTNNTDDDVRRNIMNVKVQVRYGNSIKFVDVLNEAYPVGVEFE